MLSYAIQEVGNASEHTTPKGPIDPAGFKAAIDAFAWADQHAAWDRTQDGPLPAVILCREEDQREFWVTAWSGSPDGGYQVVSVSMRLRKRLFGPAKSVQVAETVNVDKRTDLDQWIDLFCGRRYEELDPAVAQWVRESSVDDD